jgi:hypothetical protein
MRIGELGASVPLFLAHTSWTYVNGRALKGVKVKEVVQRNHVTSNQTKKGCEVGSCVRYQRILQIKIVPTVYNFRLAMYLFPE